MTQLPISLHINAIVGAEKRLLDLWEWQKEYDDDDTDDEESESTRTLDIIHSLRDARNWLIEQEKS